MLSCPKILSNKLNKKTQKMSVKKLKSIFKIQ